MAIIKLIKNGITADAIDATKIADNAIVTDGINADAVTLAKMASGTDGNIISYDTSGDPVAVATGSSGQVLTSAGAGAVPSFQDAAGGGKINQVLMATKTNTQVTSSTNSWVDVSDLSIAITPSASNSKILVHFCCNISCSIDNHAAIKLVRGSTDIFVHDVDSTNVRLFSGWRTTSASQYHAQVQTGSFLDTPSTTSATTYKIQGNGNDGFNINRPHAGDNQSTVQRTRGASSIIVMEVLA